MCVFTFEGGRGTGEKLTEVILTIYYDECTYDSSDGASTSLYKDTRNIPTEHPSRIPTWRGFSSSLNGCRSGHMYSRTGHRRMRKLVKLRCGEQITFSIFVISIFQTLNVTTQFIQSIRNGAVL